MPMSRNESIEKVQRLLTAYNKTREMLESEPVTWELHPGTDIARNWTVITSAYSGAEQTLKFLIAEENGLTIPELISFTDPNNIGADKHPYRTHNLGRLFSKLQKSTQDVVREFFARYRSLHSYIAIGSADDFLNGVSGRQGTGYERWRYTLIEDEPPPKNSPEALVAIWGVCVQIAEERLWTNQRVLMPDKELTHTLRRHLEMLLNKVSVDRQNAGEPFQDVSAEIRDWLWRGDHPLNAFAQVLWHFARYDSHGVEDASEWLSDTLSRWVNDVTANPSASARTSLRAFLTRAQGLTREGQSIQWNPSRNRFEAVHWSLEQRFNDTLSPQATVICDDLSRHQAPLATLWAAAKDSGYGVLENRAFDGPPGENIWFRTLEVRAEDAGTVRPILAIWQQRNTDHDRFYMVEEYPLEEVAQPLRRWVELARTLGQMRSG